MDSNPKRITFLVFFDFFNNGGMAKSVDAKDFRIKLSAPVETLDVDSP